MSSATGDSLFVDSNVFIYAETREEPQHEEARALRDKILQGAFNAHVSPQVLSEVFSSVSHQGRSGPEEPLSPARAAELIRNYYESEDIALIYPGPQTVGLMLSLLAAHPVTGPRIHDIRIAATMLENGVSRIATYDTHVFSHLPGITVLSPREVLQQAKASTAAEPDQA